MKKNARRAGLLYLLWVITGIIGVFYVPSKTIVRGDAAATANKILANEFLFRTGIINDLISIVIGVFLIFTLYRLFKQVDEHRARLMVSLLFVSFPVAFVMNALSLCSLMIFKGELLTSFAVSERQDLAMLFFKINDYGVVTLEMFWGLWLIPFGQLVSKSGFIPRILGVFLILNGVAYIIPAFTSLLFPDYLSTVRVFSIPFWILGEISIMLWLLIKGVRVPAAST